MSRRLLHRTVQVARPYLRGYAVVLFCSHELAGLLILAATFIRPEVGLAGGLAAVAARTVSKQLGYAETPPDLDIDGHDAAHKIGILASLAHGFWVNPKQIHVEGIRHVTALDIKFAGDLGYTIKLLGVVKIACGTRNTESKLRTPRSAL